MSKSLNKVLLIGHLGSDPETRETRGGLVAHFNLATSERGTDKTTGERQERTEWHRIVLWRQLAEIARDSLKKGDRAYIEGSLQTRPWQTQDGQDRTTTEIVGHEWILLGGGRSNAPSRAEPKPDPQSEPVPDPQSEPVPISEKTPKTGSPSDFLTRGKKAPPDPPVGQCGQ